MKAFKELQEVLPPLAKDDYERLKNDIKKNGIRIPIIKLPDKTIIDGFHREKIAKELNLKDKDIPRRELKLNKKQAIYLGLSLNLTRRHLTSEQKEEIIKKRGQLDLTQEEMGEVVGFTQERIAQMEKEGSIINIYNTSPPDLRYKISKEDEEDIVKQTETETQKQIASDYGINEPRVRQIAKKHKQPPKKGFSWLRYYDVWNFSERLEGFGEKREAQCPPQVMLNFKVMLNFIYYFTKQDNLIVDPMAGGGAMTDCAKYLNRRSQCWDIDPFPKKDVKYNEIRKGYPSEAENCDAIFIDPPYGAQKGETFKKELISNLSTSDFVNIFLKKLFIDSYKTLKKGGKIGFIIMNQCHIKLEGRPYWDFAFESFSLMEQAGFTPYRRISIPLIGPVQYKETDMKRAKDNKELLGILRDLIVMEKKERNK